MVNTANILLLITSGSDNRTILKILSTIKKGFGANSYSFSQIFNLYYKALRGIRFYTGKKASKRL